MSRDLDSKTWFLSPDCSEILEIVYARWRHDRSGRVWIHVCVAPDRLRNRDDVGNGIDTRLDKDLTPEISHGIDTSWNSHRIEME